MNLVELDSSQFAAWNNFVDAFPLAHGYQRYEWGEVKKAQGWQPQIVALVEGGKILAGAQILTQKVPLVGKKVMQIPFGPVLDYNNDKIRLAFFAGLRQYLEKSKVLLCKMHPYVFEPIEIPDYFVKTEDILLYKNTLLIDLRKTADEIFLSFDKKLKNEIRKAKKLGTLIEESKEYEKLEAFYKMYEDTYRRGQQSPLSKAVYQNIYTHFITKGHGRLFIATIGNDLLSGGIFLTTGKTWVYMWGASTGDSGYRKYEAQKLLLWQAIQTAVSEGYETFDLGGVTIGAEQHTKKHGIYTFKHKYCKEVANMAGTYQVNPNELATRVVLAGGKFYTKLKG